MMVPQSMIEKIALPIDTASSSGEFFPMLDRRCHSGFPREGDDCVQVIWHEQTKAAMPSKFLMVMLKSTKDSIAFEVLAELVLTGWDAFNRDKEPTTFLHPLWNGMRKFLTPDESHG
jgi:hypothetical protein